MAKRRLAPTRAIQDKTTAQVRDHLVHWFRQSGYPNAMIDVYRHNPVSIRVRVIDDAFRGKTIGERDAMTVGMLDDLPEKIERDVSLVLLLSPEETADHFMNLEFEAPSPPVV